MTYDVWYYLLSAKDSADQQEMEALIDTYKHALGME